MLKAVAGARSLKPEACKISRCSSAHVARDIAETCATREAAGQPKIVGVTAFPPLKAETVEIEYPASKAANAPAHRLPGSDDHCPPLTPVRLSAAYEAAQ